MVLASDAVCARCALAGGRFARFQGHDRNALVVRLDGALRQPGDVANAFELKVYRADPFVVENDVEQLRDTDVGLVAEIRDICDRQRTVRAGDVGEIGAAVRNYRHALRYCLKLRL